MCYDTVMMSRYKMLSLLCTIAVWLSSLSAISFYPTMQLDDPFSSQRMLVNRQFLSETSSQERDAADQLEISITTMGKGDPLYVWFGHSGLVITDKNSGRSVMYDYGIFSFDDDFYQTFAMGRLNYEVWATSAPARNQMAIDEDRDLSTVVLNLPDSAKLELVEFLNFNVQEENNTYLYHHYDENCSTRIRDLVDKSVGGQFKRWATEIPYDLTLRQLVMLHTASSPFIDWTLNFLQSGVIDHPISLWEAMFLPAVLEQALLEFSYTDTDGSVIPIVTSQETLHTATAGIRTPVAETWESVTIRDFLFGLSLAVILIIFGRLFQNCRSTSIRKMGTVISGLLNFMWTFAVGILSTILLFMMVASNHDVTYFNENILFANPWLVVMAVQALKAVFKRERALEHFRKGNTFMAVMVLVTIALKGVFHDLLIQMNWQTMFTLLPLYAANSSIPFERWFRRRRPVLDDSDF